MSEDFDDITDGPISIERAKHHCGRLAVDCGWRAMEVEMHIDAQAKRIAELNRKLDALRNEVKAWRDADEREDMLFNTLGEEDRNRILQAITNTDNTGALEDER